MAATTMGNDSENIGTGAEPTPPCGYCQSHIPSDIMRQLEAGAFRSLCSHLRARSDEVQNIDLMTVSGFCRNCLAKWLVVEARKISEGIKARGDVDASSLSDEERNILQALDALGYDEAAQEIYGCGYPEWKKRHAKKATDEQMKRYNDSKPIHAQHDKDLLKTRADKPASLKKAMVSNDAATPASALLSDVCCQDVDNVVMANSVAVPSVAHTRSGASTNSHNALAPPKGGISLKVGILTVSDRAAANQYKTGDLSGPAVEQSFSEVVGAMNAGGSELVTYSVVCQSIVPDDVEAIKTITNTWSGKSGVENKEDTKMGEVCDVILTTGGTGFAPRDKTPEATLSVLDRECPGLMAWVSTECAAQQPMASLSRGTAGICGRTVIANLPGNPAGVLQVMRVLLPLLLHAVKDIQEN